MWESATQLKYKTHQILNILDSYQAIHDCDFDKVAFLDYPQNGHSVFYSPFEIAIDRKADVDMAIDKLGKRGKWLEWCKDIYQPVDGLNDKQTKLARYIQGDIVSVIHLAKELSGILSSGELV